MHTDGLSTPDESLSVRLRWPGAATDGDGGGAPDQRSSVGADEVPAAEVHAAEILPAGGRAGRSLIEAYDRLGDRVLERMRSLREDVDADLAAVRSELASLRQAVDDVGDRVQLRQLRATIDELRSDVTGLRRAVLEWPELEQVSSDVAGLRSDMSNLLDTGRARDAVPTGTGAPDAGTGAVSLGALAPLVEEISALRGEVTALRRRISLRADREPNLDAAQLERLAELVAERMGPKPRRAKR